MFRTLHMTALRAALLPLPSGRSVVLDATGLTRRPCTLACVASPSHVLKISNSSVNPMVISEEFPTFADRELAPSNGEWVSTHAILSA